MVFLKPIPSSFDELLKAAATESLHATFTLGAKPFLKWVGGKRSILPELLGRLPKSYSSYHEVFIGGGALFFALQPKCQCYLSDINPYLVASYIAVRSDVEELLKSLKQHQKSHSAKHFRRCREQLTAVQDATSLAALFIYLNKTCFNGLFRVNKDGKFNVPQGAYVTPGIYDEKVLRNDSKTLKPARIKQRSFEDSPILKDGFYYLDPPYHKTFSSYDGSGFGDAKHEQLAKFCAKLDKAGAKFMLSNSDTPFIRKLYGEFLIETVKASRSVSCKASQRKRENEILVRNYTE